MVCVLRLEGRVYTQQVAREQIAVRLGRDSKTEQQMCRLQQQWGALGRPMQGLDRAMQGLWQPRQHWQGSTQQTQALAWQSVARAGVAASCRDWHGRAEGTWHASIQQAPAWLQGCIDVAPWPLQRALASSLESYIGVMPPPQTVPPSSAGP